MAADLSPTRRALAAAMGANAVVDPGGENGISDDRAAGFALSVDAFTEAAPAGAAPVVFEALGVPGMIEMAMTGAPPETEIVVGVCIATDRFRPVIEIYKRPSIRFVLGWTRDEFVESLHRLAGGRRPKAWSPVRCRWTRCPPLSRPSPGPTTT